MSFRVVTPTLGTSPWLDAALAGDVPAERVLVAPPEQTAALAARFAGAAVLPEQTRGLYAAVNQGLRAAGEWSVGTYLNDDDRLLAAGVARAQALLAAQPALAGVFGRVAMIDAAGRFLAEIPVAHRGADWGPLLAAGVMPLAQPGTLFRRELFDELGGFDERFRGAGDLDFFQRAAAAGRRFGFVNAWVAEFRVHAGQISKQRELMQHESRLLFRRAAERPEWRAASRRARWRFRAANLPAYLGRLRRHGWVSMERLYARA